MVVFLAEQGMKETQKEPHMKTQTTLREEREEEEQALKNWLAQMDKEFGPERTPKILSLILRYTRSLKMVH